MPRLAPASIRLAALVLLAAPPACSPLRAQSLPIPETPESVLTQMAAHAGVIFTGEVVAITRADAAGYVDIRFRVDTPIRNSPPAQAHYVLREWAGLWTGGDRYFQGQRLLMLLTARSASGFSAPVRGRDGALPLLAAAQPPLLNAAGQPAPDQALAPAELHVDMRWIAAQTVRKALRSSSPTPEAAPPGPADWLGPFTSLAAAAQTANPTTQPTLGAIVTLLQTAAAQNPDLNPAGDPIHAPR